MTLERSASFVFGLYLFCLYFAAFRSIRVLKPSLRNKKANNFSEKYFLPGMISLP
jgi:hypothetical protein